MVNVLGRNSICTNTGVVNLKKKALVWIDRNVEFYLQSFGVKGYF